MKIRTLSLLALSLLLSGGLRAMHHLTQQLDASASSLTASALKNESVTVKVSFPILSGSLNPENGKAEVSADLKGLSTGNPARDGNIQNLFFEVAKKAAFGTATFSWKGKPKELAALEAGKPQQVTLKGKLKLHGKVTQIGGPATLSKLDNGGYQASFSSWRLSIDELKMLKPLAEMNKLCPQPHRVADTVQLDGVLTFKKP